MKKPDFRRFSLIFPPFLPKIAQFRRILLQNEMFTIFEKKDKTVSFINPRPAEGPRMTLPIRGEGQPSAEQISGPGTQAL